VPSTGSPGNHVLLGRSQVRAHGSEGPGGSGEDLHGPRHRRHLLRGCQTGL